MLGGNPGLSLSIELDPPNAYYTNGDTLRGRMVVENQKPLTVRNIEIKLRCEEFAHVWVPNGQGGHYETETLRYLSLRHTVFPTKSVRYHPDADPNARYTIQSGLHAFPFEFQIPIADRYPQTVAIKGSESGIKWYLKGVVHRGQVLSSTKRAFKQFEMRPSSRLDYDHAPLLSVSDSRPLVAFLPGYAAWVKTPAAKLKDMIPGYRHLRKKIAVNMTMTVPKEGLLQTPHPLNIFLNLECTEPEDSQLLLIRGFELQLKQKIVVSVNDGWDSSAYRVTYALLSLRDLNYPLKDGIDRLEQLMARTSVEGRLPSTLTNQHFDVSYKLVMVVALASKEKPGTVERLRLSVPVVLHSFIPNGASGRRADADAAPEFEELPSYHQLPTKGESTLSDTAGSPGPDNPGPSLANSPDHAAPHYQRLDPRRPPDIFLEGYGRTLGLDDTHDSPSLDSPVPDSPLDGIIGARCAQEDGSSTEGPLTDPEGPLSDPEGPLSDPHGDRPVEARPIHLGSAPVSEDDLPVYVGSTPMGSIVVSEGDRPVSVGNKPVSVGDRSVSLGSALVSEGQARPVYVESTPVSAGDRSVPLGHTSVSMGDHAVPLGSAPVSMGDQSVPLVSVGDRSRTLENTVSVGAQSVSLQNAASAGAQPVPNAASAGAQPLAPTLEQKIRLSQELHTKPTAESPYTDLLTNGRRSQKPAHHFHMQDRLMTGHGHLMKDHLMKDHGVHDHGHVGKDHAHLNRDHHHNQLMTGHGHLIKEMPTEDCARNLPLSTHKTIASRNRQDSSGHHRAPSQYEPQELFATPPLGPPVAALPLESRRPENIPLETHPVEPLEGRRGPFQHNEAPRDTLSNEAPFPGVAQVHSRPDSLETDADSLPIDKLAVHDGRASPFGDRDGTHADGGPPQRTFMDDDIYYVTP